MTVYDKQIIYRNYPRNKSVLSVLFLYPAGFNLPKRSTVFWGFQNEEALLKRLTRNAESEDVSDVSSSESSSSSSSSESHCETYRNCLLPNNRSELSELIFRFKFNEIPGVLSTVCAELSPEPCNNTQCVIDGNHSYNDYIDILNGIWDWICDHSDEFEAGTSCWTEELKADMETCQSESSSPATFVDCASMVAYGVDSCTVQDADLIHSLFATIVELYEEIFGIELM